MKIAACSALLCLLVAGMIVVIDMMLGLSLGSEPFHISEPFRIAPASQTAAVLTLIFLWILRSWNAYKKENGGG
ncbi:hypothetical protein [Paenibacillus beijingensis]|uniref:Uncharacterized protein n=1 Tax=Paenibacillus beijingensis TaxID=1126833 RepID=A0A0D5NH12_9BACL|nr:hypothetical protein [Paenibacillus beijingensis]AJY74571.1 hypothetical protein VN24_08290 [Paenibacillus beijingensis]